MKYDNQIDSVRHPLLNEIAQDAAWTSEDKFPAWPEWADYYEERLAYIKTAGELSRFLPRLKGNAYQRDRTLAEIAAAFFLERTCSLSIIEWEPLGNDGRRGEYLVEASSINIFVEVKTAGWQKDVVQDQGRHSPRLNQPKYLQGEARSVGPWQVIRNAVMNAYPKFPAHMSTLLVIWEDYFTPLDKFNAGLALYCRAVGTHTSGYLAENGYFTDNRFERLGAIGILGATLSSGGLKNKFSLYENTKATTAASLPSNIFDGYARYNQDNY